jgi:hypothetical protein
MIESPMAGLLRHLPDGMTEIYAHPATSGAFEGAASNYRYADEVAALTAPAVLAAARPSGARWVAQRTLRNLSCYDTSYLPVVQWIERVPPKR